jgi:ligand-binding sensor domain-containing protein/signal transduction histidine kinase
MKKHCGRNAAANSMFRRAMLAGVAASLLLLPGRGFALDSAKSLFQFNCQNWTRQNALPADKINCVTQSKNGFLWLGTQNGLVRFDGQEFKKIPINLPSAHGQDVRQVIAARDGLVRFAIHNGGFGSYDGQKFSALGDDRWAQRSMNAIDVLEATDGAIWTSGDMALGRWVEGEPDKSLFILSTNGIVLSLCEDASGRIWIGTVEHGLSYWADGKMVPFPEDQLKDQNIFALAVDAENQIWAGTGNGLHCYYPTGQAKEIPPIGSEIKALLVDRHGILWVGTTGMGLARYEAGKFDFLKKVDGLGSDNVTSLFEDAEGSLWVGTVDGLSQLSDVKFPIYSSKEGLGEGSTVAVAAAKAGGLWIANSSSGVTFFDGQNITNYSGQPLFSSPYCKTVFQASNGVVYAVDGAKNLNVFAGGQLLARYPNPAWPETLAEDSHGVLAGIGDTLFRIQDGKLQPYLYKDGVQPVFYWIINLCVAKDGVIWVASNNGIFRLQDGTFKRWSATNGLSGDRTYWVCEDVDGGIWAGLPTGLARIKNGRIKNITQQDGLPDDRIFAIVPDDHGYFWCDSGRGIFRASRQALNDFADGKTGQVKCELFDGLESVKSVDRTDQGNSGCKTLDGRIWFPSPWGVVMIDPAHLPTNSIAPPVQIERVLANGKEFDPDKDIVAPPGKGELEIDFAGLSYIAPQQIRYRYQLAGYDKDWVETEGRRLAFYTNLKPGRYTFRVLAANADGIWNETGDSFKFELRPHFYQTIWFLLGVVALALAALGGAYAGRVRHLNRRQQALQKARDLLETEVTNRTAELAAANTSLQREIDQHKQTAAALKERTQALETEIEERKQMQLEVERVHQRLLETSRQAGMAEVATNVLHNVGNVLNSVNVSAALVEASTKQSKVSSLAKVAALLNEHAADLGGFMTRDPKGRQLPGYLSQLAEQLARDQQNAIAELELLRQNIEHIMDIIAMQQNYAKISGVTETVKMADLVEDALRMNNESLVRHEIGLIREYADVPPVTVEKHRVLQILVNLIRNAKHACDESGRKDKQMTMRVANGEGRIKISVADNGIGIPPENLTRIFSHGFTTRKDGHGFGLHSGALAAKEMGGALTVRSDGPGKGATFTLELPSNRNEDSNE